MKPTFAHESNSRRLVFTTPSRPLRSAVLVVCLWTIICAQVFGGELERHVIQSRSLENNIVGLTTNREIQVLLPDSYATSDRSYPVVYWFPGGGQRAAANVLIDDIESEFTSGRSEEAIIVFMDSQTEFGTSLYLSNDVFGDWQSHLTDEIVPFVDALYRTHDTQDQRAIAGFSLGGLTSVLTPIFSPGVFGAVGANDPSVGFTAGAIRTTDELPEGWQPSTNPRPLSEFFENFPDTVQGYGEAPLGTSAFGQLAVTLTPNPDVPLLGQIPFELNEAGQGVFIPEVVEVWRDFDLLNPDTVALYADTLQELSTVSVTFPETAVNTNRAWGRAMLNEFDQAGVSTSWIEFAGDHNDFQHDRFTALLGDLTFAMKGESRTTIQDGSYSQDFDAFTGDANSPRNLPSGWSVGLVDRSVFRDTTNTSFNGGNFEVAGNGPHILELGLASDTALGVHLPQADDTAAIQFVADIDNLNANAIELSFDIEAWDAVAEAGAEPVANQVGFKVSAEFDFGSGFESKTELGEVSLTDLVIPDGDFIDGNATENRASFSLLGGAPFVEAEAIRLLFETDSSLSSPGWTFGIDDVELEFSFLGDFDSDNELTIRDVNLLSAATRHSGLRRFDLTGDGVVDSDDIRFWATHLFGTDLGDTNLDNAVDFSDFLRFASNFGSDNPVVWEDGDFDADGVVGFSDFLAFSRGFQASALRAQKQAIVPSSGNSLTSVPEPTSNGVLTLMVPFLLCLRPRLAPDRASTRAKTPRIVT